jgi:NADH-ubiquinone oxidoreductase chain 6
VDPETLGIVHIWVIINKNPIFAVLCLIGLIGSISIYLIFIGLTFIGLAYIIIYVGAVKKNG